MGKSPEKSHMPRLKPKYSFIFKWNFQPSKGNIFLWENKTSFFEKQILGLNSGLIFNKAGDNLPQGTGDNITLESKLLFNTLTSEFPVPYPLIYAEWKNRITYLFSIHIKQSFSSSGLNVNNCVARPPLQNTLLLISTEYIFFPASDLPQKSSS